MCPHEILTVKGYALEDYWGTEWEKRYLDCVNDPRIEKRSVTVKDIVRLVLRSAVETGTPFAFNRDSVNPVSYTHLLSFLMDQSIKTGTAVLLGVGNAHPAQLTQLLDSLLGKLIVLIH